jgi:3',5'-cyclic AMP phosphodiesterase CpdA
VLTDTHIENGQARGLEKLQRVIQDNGQIKFVVFTGDITQNGARQDLQKFIDIARSFDIPCYPVIGNHDIYFNNWPNWKDLIGSTCYRVDGDAVSLFILDSANAFWGKNQLDWLQRELKSARGRVFVFTHCNLFVESPADLQQTTDTKERAHIISLLKGRCDIMFAGHLHKETVREAGGVRYITVEAFVEKQTYCLVSVKRTGVSYAFEKL